MLSFRDTVFDSQPVVVCSEITVLLMLSGVCCRKELANT